MLSRWEVVGLRQMSTASDPPSYTPIRNSAALSAILQGQPLIVGLAFWPGGTEADWGPGNPDLSGLNPCNASHHANLVRAINMFDVC